MASRLAQKAGFRHANSDQGVTDAKTILTRSKSDMPTTSKRMVDIGRSYERHTDELSATDHTNSQFECTANYWPAGLSLPESGKLRLDDSSLLFQGTHTELTLNYQQIAIEKASRMGGLIHDAFKIITADKEEYLFTTILKDRKLVFDTIHYAISEAKIHPVVKKKEKSFQLPPDEIMSKMNIIGKERLKGVSIQVCFALAHACPCLVHIDH